ncbi:MAG: sigma-70 family RNA polymerase sigma factor [Fimbriimonadaceae bacterium]|nr:sigma-70 family RNA polymerase sigma factor [Fimbriimonadaceae bacterium]
MAESQAATAGRLSQATDEAVVELCLAQGTEHFAELVDRYREPIYGLALHLTGDAEEARDLAQQSFLQAYCALPRFRPGHKFSSWLYTIAANLCRSWLRKQRHRPASIERDFADPEVLPAAATVTSPERAHTREELRRQVLAAVNSLPTKYRVVVVLRHLNDLSYKQIADILNLPTTTVEHRLRTAREMLRERLGEDFAWEPDD